MKDVRSAVDQVALPMKVSKTIGSQQEVAQLLRNVREVVEADDSGKGMKQVELFERWFLPPDTDEEPQTELVLTQEAQQEPPVSAKDLVNELRDHMDGPDFQPALRERLDVAFNQLEAKLVARVKWTPLPRLALLLAPFKDIAASLFNKEEERQDLIAKLNEVQSNRDLFTCVFSDPAAEGPAS